MSTELPSDVLALLAQAQAIVDEAQKSNYKPVAEGKATPKLNSIKPKKQPKIQSGAQYHYDPATYKELHKVSTWHLLDTVEDVEKVVQDFKDRKVSIMSVDTETMPLTQYATALDVPRHIVRRYVKKNANDVPFGISFSDGIQAYFATCGFEILKELLEDESIIKLLANAKYDLHELENIGIVVKGEKRDVQILVKLWNENLSSYRLKDLGVKFIDKDANKWEIMKDNWMAEHRTKDWTAVPKELMGDYGASDAWLTFKLHEKFDKYMDEYEMRPLYQKECRLIDVAYRMERIGFRCDRQYLQEARVEFEKEIAEKYAIIYDMAGGIININSAQQLEKFFLAQGVDPREIKRTDKGNASFDKDELERLANKFDVANKIMEVKKLEKLLSSYIINISNTLPASDRTHCNINVMEAVTGRMSITDPALQTLPKKDKRIRKAFIPSEGKALFFFDLDQIEYRLYAHYCQDGNLIQAIKNGWDVHKATAAIIFNKPYDDVTEDERSKGKTDNFALVYGVGAAHLAEINGITEEEAKRTKREYFDKLPKAKVFIKQVEEVTKIRGYIRNIYGRRRRLTKDEVYKAPNALIQGCAADFIKEKMVKLSELLKDYKTEMVNVVHDELIFEIPYEEINVVAPLIKQTIDEFETFRAPVTCGCEWSMYSWGQKMDYDLSKSFEENKKDFIAKYGEVA